MSGKMARSKGRRGEVEIRDLLQAVVTKVCDRRNVPELLRPQIERNLTQSRGGGADLQGLDWLALEVKYQEKEYNTDWWDQAKRQTKQGQETILIYRRNFHPWRVRMYGFLGSYVKTPVDVALDAFLVWFECRVEEDLVRKGKTVAS
jgi:UTP:GlnB (protein PII) uridylyltransferase